MHFIDLYSTRKWQTGKQRALLLRSNRENVFGLIQFAYFSFCLLVSWLRDVATVSGTQLVLDFRK